MRLIRLPETSLFGVILAVYLVSLFRLMDGKSRLPMSRPELKMTNQVHLIRDNGAMSAGYAVFPLKHGHVNFQHSQ